MQGFQKARELFFVNNCCRFWKLKVINYLWFNFILITVFCLYYKHNIAYLLIYENSIHKTTFPVKFA